MKHLVMAAGLLSVSMLAATQIAIAGSVTDKGTLTAGTVDAGCEGGTFIHIGFGDYLGTNFGSYSSTTFTGGKKLVDLWDQSVAGNPAECPAAGVVFEVSGFSSNPGSSWLTSVTCNGTELTASTATFTYTSGDSQWFWAGKTFSFVSGDKYSCSIVHDDP